MISGQREDCMTKLQRGVEAVISFGWLIAILLTIVVSTIGLAITDRIDRTQG